MADSEATICNLALRHLGVSTSIATLTERSAEAGACNRFFEQVRDEVLRDFPWPFATTIDDLGLVEDFTAGTTAYEWGYSYRYPDGCLRFRRILSGSRNDSKASRIPYKVGRDDDGQLIFTDMEEARAEWTTRVDDVTEWPPDFCQAMALLLAGYIGPSVAAGDQFKLGDRALQLYQFRMGTARANALNEQQLDEPPDSEFISGR